MVGQPTWDEAFRTVYGTGTVLETVGAVIAAFGVSLHIIGWGWILGEAAALFGGYAVGSGFLLCALARVASWGYHTPNPAAQLRGAADQFSVEEPVEEVAD